MLDQGMPHTPVAIGVGIKQYFYLVNIYLLSLYFEGKKKLDFYIPD